MRGVEKINSEKARNVLQNQFKLCDQHKYVICLL